SWRAEPAPFTGTEPRCLRRAKIELGFDRRSARPPTRIEPMTLVRNTWRGPLAFGHPAAGAMFVKRLRWDALLHPHAQHRLRHQTRVSAFQPVIPPTQRLLQESDSRTGHSVVRIEMSPRSDEAFARDLESRQEPGNRVAVGIGPAADGIHGAGDGTVVFAHRAVFPVIVAPGMLEPHLGDK